MFSKLVACVLIAALPAFAQTTPEFSPPPMVPATPPSPTMPPPTPTPEPAPLFVQPGTPPPPSTLPPPGYVPGQPNTGYPYSPYGAPQPARDEKPPFEWGLAISESLFGMLTSAAISLIAYFLLLRPMVDPNAGQGLGLDNTVSTVIFILIFAATPLAVSQTQLSLANGSRYYFSESWPAALAGLAAEAAVLGLFFAEAASHKQVQEVPPMRGGNEPLLLIGTVVAVPLIEMAVINLFKSPRVGRVAAVSRDTRGGFALGVPTVAPLIGQTRVGLGVGLQAQLINVRF